MTLRFERAMIVQYLRAPDCYRMCLRRDPIIFFESHYMQSPKQITSHIWYFCKRPVFYSYMYPSTGPLESSLFNPSRSLDTVFILSRTRVSILKTVSLNSVDVVQS